MFWKDISDQGSDEKTIQDNMFLYEFAYIFDNYSLFHHFADDVELI